MYLNFFRIPVRNLSGTIVTFHFFSFFAHHSEGFLISHNLFNVVLEFILQAIDLTLGFGQFIDFREVTVFVDQFVGCFFGVGFDVLFSLVLAVVDLFDFVLQFLDETIDMSFRVGLVGTDGVGDVVVIMGNVPDSVCCFEFVPISSFGFQYLYLLRYLSKTVFTLSTSAERPLLPESLIIVYMGMEVE